jgi:hypothetical protein
VGTSDISTLLFFDYLILFIISFLTMKLKRYRVYLILYVCCSNYLLVEVLDD